MCNTTHFNPTRFDNAKAEAFAYKLMNILNSGGLALLISIGHRSGSVVAPFGPVVRW